MKCYNCEKENTEESKFCSNCGCTLSMDFDYPQLNSRYNVLEIIAAGGMSTVLKAEDVNLGNTICAIKEMNNDFKNQKERIYAVQKFKDEAFILAKMRHSNIPVVTDYFVENDKYYLVMNFIKGKNLKELAKERPGKRLSEDEIKKIGIQICEILEYLHNLEPPIIHRDLKPSNFVLEEDTGNVILIDFGIARRFEPEKTGTLIGTPGYMAPEQYTGKIDIRSDIFGLGATLHHLITGDDPSERESIEFSLVTDSRPDISLHMESVINKAVESNSGKRFQSARELRLALTHKGYLELPSLSNRAPYKPLPPPRLVPTYLEIGKKTNIAPSKKEIQGITRKASKPTVPVVEQIINVQLQSFLDKNEIRNILGNHIGIDIGTSSIKILQMGVDDRYFMYPVRVVVIPVPLDTIREGVIINPLNISTIIQKALVDCNIKATKAVLSIPKHQGHFYSCLLPELTEAKLQEIIPDLARKHFPFYNETTLLDYQIIKSYLPGQEGKMEVIIASVEKKVIDILKGCIKKSGLELGGIKFQPFLLNHAINLIASDNLKSKSLVIVDIGAENTSINIVKDGCLWYTKLFHLGGNDFTSAIADKLNIDFNKAEELKCKHLSLSLSETATETETIMFNLTTAIIKNLLNEIMKTIEDFKLKYKMFTAFPILFSGETVLIKNFDKYIENELRIRCFKFKMPVSKVLDTNKDIVSEIGASLMVSFSLAMSSLLLEGEFFDDSSQEKEEKKSIWNILKYKIF